MRSIVAILLFLFAGVSLQALTEEEYLEAKKEYEYVKAVMDQQFQAQYEKYLIAKERAQCSQCNLNGPNKAELSMVKSNWRMWKAIAQEQYSFLDEKWQEVEKIHELTIQKMITNDSWKLHPSQDPLFPRDTRGPDKRRKEKVFSLRNLQKTLDRHPGNKCLKPHIRALEKLQKSLALEEVEEASEESVEIPPSGHASTPPVTLSFTERPPFRREEHRQHQKKAPPVRRAKPNSRPYVCKRNTPKPNEATVAACAAIFYHGLWR